MKISCLKEDLAHGLGVVSHALPTTRVLMHITQSVLLSAKDSKLKLSTTNLEMFASGSPFSCRRRISAAAWAYWGSL